MGTPEVRHVAVAVRRPAAEVYEFASRPENLTRWATGLGTLLGPDGDDWVLESPMGRIRLRFAERNPYGVLDHDVVLESGERFHNPMRVVPVGERSELLFTLCRLPGVSDAKFEEDAAWVRKDLERLRDLLEA